MTKYFWREQVALIVLITILTAISSTTWADKNDSAFRPLTLRNIMQKLSKNMQIVIDAISREDWEQVAKTAPQIANHPQPPIAEKMRILRFAGSNVSKFKRLDKQTHQAAKELEEIAMKKDREGAIAKFATLQKSCLACHQSFRKTFKEHFYGK
jgi:cytochrome c556